MSGGRGKIRDLRITCFFLLRDAMMMSYFLMREAGAKKVLYVLYPDTRQPVLGKISHTFLKETFALYQTGKKL